MPKGHSSVSEEGPSPGSPWRSHRLQPVRPEVPPAFLLSADRTEVDQGSQHCLASSTLLLPPTASRGTSGLSFLVCNVGSKTECIAAAALLRPSAGTQEAFSAREMLPHAERLPRLRSRGRRTASTLSRSTLWAAGLRGHDPATL